MSTPALAATAPLDGSRFTPALQGTRGVVSTEDPHATATALRILAAGGNAVDAAVGAIFTIGVTKPEACGIGGGGFLVATDASGHVRTLDFRETAPRSPAYTPRRQMQVPTQPSASYQETGRGVVGVPGTVAGMDEAFRQLGSGRLPWADLLADAVRHADAGFVTPQSTRRWIQERAPEFTLFPESTKLFLVPDAATTESGARAPYRLRFPDYAQTLRRIAERGAAEFYTGDTARQLAAEMAHISGHEMSGDKSEMTYADLASYRAQWRDPVVTTYRGNKVYGPPAPTAGPTVVLETLNILEGFDLAAMGRGSAEYVHHVAEAKKLAWADRSAYFGDPGFVQVPTKTLTSKEYAEQRRALIGPTAGTFSAGQTEVEPGAATATSTEGSQTTSLSIMDEQGNAVSITCSLETGFGSAYVPAGLGFVLNGQLYDFDDVPLGTPVANAPAPGKRPRSSQSPMLVLKGGKPVLATGGQGGTHIPGGVLASILHTVDFDLDIARALDAPRVDATTGPGLSIEDTRYEPAVLALLADRYKHTLSRLGEYGHLAVVSAVAADPRTGTRTAAGDPRDERVPAAQT